MRIATVGTASTVTWLPNTLTLSPAQSLRKSGWRHSLPRNTARFYPERTLEEGNARQRELCPQPRHRHAAGRGALWPRLCAHTGQSGFRGAAHRRRVLRWPGTGLRPRVRVTASRRHRFPALGTFQPRHHDRRAGRAQPPHPVDDRGRGRAPPPRLWLDQSLRLGGCRLPRAVGDALRATVSRTRARRRRGGPAGVGPLGQLAGQTARLHPAPLSLHALRPVLYRLVSPAYRLGGPLPGLPLRD